MSDQKIVLVTGCAKGGIGYEYCKAFAEKNCYVFASDVAGKIQHMSDLSYNNIKVLELDVASEESVGSAVAIVIAECGKIDVLINNAGVGSCGPLAELPLDEIRKVWEVNVLGQLRLMQHVVPYMAAQRSGCVVNVGSVIEKAPTPYAGSYCASKAAVRAMSHSLRVELKPFGIDVVLVMPGAVRSNIGIATIEKLRHQEWKLYREFKEVIAERAMASQTGKATNATVFARHVAKKVLSPKPPKQIIFGHLTWVLTILSWSPLWVRDLFYANKFKLDKKLKSN